MTKETKILGWILMAIIALLILVVFAVQAHAATWRASQAKGEYRCIGSGSVAGKAYVWMGALKLDGKRSGSLEYGIIKQDASSQEESANGSIEVTSSGVLSFEATGGAVYMVGPLVQSGKGILLSITLWAGDELYHFSANCWR